MVGHCRKVPFPLALWLQGGGPAVQAPRFLAGRAWPESRAIERQCVSDAWKRAEQRRGFFVVVVHHPSSDTCRSTRLWQVDLLVGACMVDADHALTFKSMMFSWSRARGPTARLLPSFHVHVHDASRSSGRGSGSIDRCYVTDHRYLVARRCAGTGIKLQPAIYRITCTHTTASTGRSTVVGWRASIADLSIFFLRLSRRLPTNCIWTTSRTWS